MRWCWVNFQCWGVLLIWIIVGQGPTVLAVGAGGVVWMFFSLVYHFSLLSPSLWETARYRLKYCLKGPLSPKQPTNQPAFSPSSDELERSSSPGHGHFLYLLQENSLFYGCELLIGSASSPRCNQSGCGVSHLGCAMSVFGMVCEGQGYLSVLGC